MLDDAYPAAERRVSHRRCRRAEDRNDGSADGRRDVSGPAVVGHDDARSLEQRHQLRDRRFPRKHGHAGPGQPRHLTAQPCLRPRSDEDRRESPLPNAVHHAGETGGGPALGGPVGARGHADQLVPRSDAVAAQRSIHSGARLGLDRQAWLGVGRQGVATERLRQRQVTVDGMPIGAPGEGRGVGPRPRRTGEADAERCAGQPDDDAAADRAVGGDRGLEADPPQFAQGAPVAAAAGAVPALVQREQTVGQTRALQQRPTGRRGHGPDLAPRPGPAQFAQERRRQHDITQKRGLNDEHTHPTPRCAHLREPTRGP